MPLCFAYGSNMDRAAMAARCPRSQPVGPARLARHRIFIMASGHASVRRDPARNVYGLLWNLALSDVRSLDVYEEIARGLYVKLTQPVIIPGGAKRALVYVGLSTVAGVPEAPYMAGIIAAARELDFPAAYMRELEGFAPKPLSGTAGPKALRSFPGVRPRYATPFER